MEKNTAGLKGAFARRYLERFSFFTNFSPTAGGHLPGERELKIEYLMLCLEN